MALSRALQRLRPLQERVGLPLQASRLRFQFPHHGRWFAGQGAAKASLWAQYNALLATHPVKTKMVTSGVIAMLGEAGLLSGSCGFGVSRPLSHSPPRRAGDAGCQLLFEDEGFSVRRQLELGAMGFLLRGPALHAWYGFLSRAVTGTGALAVAKRILLDQLVFAPVIVSCILSFLAVAQGQAGDIPRRMQEQVPGAVLNNWKVWPAAQCLNFALVPVQHQVLFSNLVSVGWNGYLSWSANQERARGAALAAARCDSPSCVPSPVLRVGAPQLPADAAAE